MPALRKRAWYSPPWAVTHPWRPRVMQAEDEYCNPTVWLQAPFLGALTVRYKTGPLRTEACNTCQAEHGPWCTGCQDCHDGPRCHNWITCGHPIPEPVHDGDCPKCGGYYCPLCEPDPTGHCPTS